MKQATIVGAGLVGSLWAIYLTKARYKVKVFEKISDIRTLNITAGKSINLAFSDRGWKALETVGIADEIRKNAIPMYGRTMHDTAGNLTFQPYGQEGQAIYSVSRSSGINGKMIDIAESSGDVEFVFNEECVGADLAKGIVYLKNAETGETHEVQSDVVFATDGTFSSIRDKAMKMLPEFQYEQRYIGDGYREILLPANADGSYKLEKNTLHIWPRTQFMLIALPNENGSFTCTLFMPHRGNKSSFENLKTKDQISTFFRNTFPDFYKLMPDVADAWDNHPLSSLVIIRCYPWTHGKTALMGDAAHATVPFYGQGMNCGFEDCSVMWKLMQEHKEDWDKVFEAYQVLRKPNGDAVQDLSLDNYYVMRDCVTNPQFLLQKRFERRISALYPAKYLPLYSQVSFSHIPYAAAYEKGREQDTFIKNLMRQHDIATLFETNKIDELIHSTYGDKQV